MSVPPVFSDDPLTPDERQRLLAIARRALEARVRGARDPVREDEETLDARRGAFVSIHHGEDLRGCLGRLEADRPVSEIVAHLGRAVADSDPRFPPVEPRELDELTIEISVLTLEREVQSLDDVEVGRHGLIVEHGHRRGLLLPQVAVQHNWDALEFVVHTCIKAGLPPDAWQQGARILVFEAQVFAEHRHTI